MNDIILCLIDSIRADLGHPVRLTRLLAANPNISVPLDTPAPCIDASSIVHWHEFGTSSCVHYPRRPRSTLMGWKHNGHHYGSFTVQRPEFEQLGTCAITENWSCEITDVHGFSASKSNLRDFANTDDMAEARARTLIDQITPEQLAANLAHREIRIIHHPGNDHFARYLWDGRLFLMNDGGSHHFAAAKYIAARLPASVPLRGKLCTYSLDPAAIASLRRDFDMFAISDLPTISQDFHEAMEAFRATWLWHELPRPFYNAKAVLFPKAESRSMKVAALLRKAGVSDLGAYLTHLASQQVQQQ